jgi:hypothetical protein
LELVRAHLDVERDLVLELPVEGFGLPEVAEATPERQELTS